MKPMTIVLLVFSSIAAVLLSTATYLYLDSRSFVDAARMADGEVIRLVHSRTSSGTSSGFNDYTYRPRVRFRTASGEEITFTSASGSSPAAYDKGEKVEVYYTADAPQEASINSFFPLWGLCSIFAGLGFIFLSIPTTILFYPWFSCRNERRLRRHGVEVLTTLLNISVNKELVVFEKHPFEVRTAWRDPSTNKPYEFTSKSLWFDPSEELQASGRTEIPVLILPGDPGTYFVDLSFLPSVKRAE